MIRTTRSRSVLLAIAAIAFTASFASNASAQTSRACTTIEQNATTILFFAHPTVTYKGLDYLGACRMADGSSGVSYRFRWESAFGNAGSSTLHFGHSNAGRIESIQSGGTTGWVAPFFASGIAVEAAKGWLLKNEQLANNPLFRTAIERADAKSILVLLLP